MGKRHDISISECERIRTLTKRRFAPQMVADLFGISVRVYSIHAYGRCSHEVDSEPAEPGNARLKTKSVTGTGLADLRGEPQASRAPSNTPVVRDLTHRFRVPDRLRGRRSSAVQYLYGDERRGMATFIRENLDIVRDALVERKDAFYEEWPEHHYRLLVEEYQFMLANGEIDPQRDGTRLDYDEDAPTDDADPETCEQ